MLHPKGKVNLIYTVLFSLTCASMTLASAPTAPIFTSQSSIRQGQTLYEAGQFSQAATVLEQALEEFSPEDTQQQAIALTNLSLIYQKLGRWEDAQNAIATSLQLLLSSSNPGLQGSALDVQGQMYLAQGQPEKAIESFSGAITAFNQAEDENSGIQSKINQAHAQRQAGFYSRSLTTLTTVKTHLQQQPNSQTKAVALRSLGITLRLIGNLKQSQEVLQESLTVAQEINSTSDISATFLALGNVTKVQGETQQALSYYQQAENSSPRGSQSRLQAQLNQLSILIKTQSRQKQLPSTSGLLNKIQSQLDDLSPSRTSVNARVNLARIALSAEVMPLDLKTLAQQLSIAVNHGKTLQDPRLESHALGTLGEVYEQSQQIKNAQQLTEDALLLVQKINAPDIAYRWQWNLGRLLADQGQREEAIAAYSTAVDTLESIRGDLVSVNSDVQFSFRESVEPVYRELVGLLLKNPVGSEPRQKDLTKARDVIESLQLAELNNFFRDNCLNGVPVVIDEVDSQAAVIYPIVLEDRLEVVVSLPNQPLRNYATNLPREEVEEVFAQLRQAVAPPGEGETRGGVRILEADVTSEETENQESSTVVTEDGIEETREDVPEDQRGLVVVGTGEPVQLQDYKKSAQKLYDWLIRPVEDEIAASDTETLVFTLDSPLLNLPMAVLHDGEKFLIEKYAVALTPGLQLLDSTPLTERELTALKAGMAGQSPVHPDWIPLPNVADELVQIDPKAPGDLLLDQTFTSNAIQEAIAAVPFPVIHLATHGQFSSNVDETFILTWDDELDINQIRGMLQSREGREDEAIELLVLSACQTATGDKRAALGLAGVAVRAGARSTIASLWSVSDQATADLMINLYEQLAQGELTKADALRQAQLSLLQDENYQDPIYWAPFVLIGNWL